MPSKNAITRKPMGRPKLPKGNARTCIIPIRFSSHDVKRIKSAANSNRQTVSAWVRLSVENVLKASDPWSK